MALLVSGQATLCCVKLPDYLIKKICNFINFKLFLNIIQLHFIFNQVMKVIKVYFDSYSIKLPSTLKHYINDHHYVRNDQFRKQANLYRSKD